MMNMFHKGKRIICRRPSQFNWLRPYNEMICGTWNSFIRTANKRRPLHRLNNKHAKKMVRK